MLECAQARTHASKQAWSERGNGADANGCRRGERDEDREANVLHPTISLASVSASVNCMYVATGVHSRIARALQSTSAPSLPPLPRPSIRPDRTCSRSRTATRLCVSRCMPFVTIQDADAECQASFATSRRRGRKEDSLYRDLRGGDAPRGKEERTGRCAKLGRPLAH